MGIKGLWQALKSYTHDGHLSQFKGQRVAVDMYVWLHQAVHQGITVNEEAVLSFLSTHSDGTCSDEEIDALLLAVINVGDGYLGYIVNRVESLQRFGVVPICVFDGADMPKKASTNGERRHRRYAAFREGLRLLSGLVRSPCGKRKDGSLLRDAAEYQIALECFEKAVDISTELAHTVVQLLKEERRVECFVAPYEADAQLAYLCREGYVRAVISEDSDLIAYYCLCVLAKVDFFSGRCTVIQPAETAPAFYAAMAAAGLSKQSKNGITTRQGDIVADASPITASRPQPATDGASPVHGVSGFTYESFLLGCVMSGCDYVPNLRNIGIKKAFRLVAHSQSFPQVLQLLQSHHGFPPEEVHRYSREILEAFYCFAHHIVYCPVRRTLVHFYPLPDSTGSGASLMLKVELVGALWPAEVAQRVCEACLHDPVTHQLYTGTYQSNLQSYLKRKRHGQTSLRVFAAFSGYQAGRVVLRPEIKRERSDTPSSEGGCGMGGPLQPVAVAPAFLPNAPTLLQGSLPMVRSKFFLRRNGKLSRCEHWSASDEDGEAKLAVATAETAVTAAMEGRNNGNSAFDEGFTACPSASSAGRLGHPKATATPPSSLTSSNTTVDGSQKSPNSALLTVGSDTEDSVTILETAPPQCLCPFGYWQCNTKHTFFLQCFLGKGWSKAVDPPTEASAPTMLCPPSSVTHSVAAKEVAAAPLRGFRPPRQTSEPLAPTVMEVARRTVRPKAKGLALFDQLAFSSSKR